MVRVHPRSPNFLPLRCTFLFRFLSGAFMKSALSLLMGLAIFSLRFRLSPQFPQSPTPALQRCRSRDHRFIRCECSGSQSALHDGRTRSRRHPVARLRGDLAHVDADHPRAGAAIYGDCAGSAGNWRLGDSGRGPRYEDGGDPNSRVGTLSRSQQSESCGARHRTDGGVCLCGAVSVGRQKNWL